jgi:SAM-dependent methyltransferase
MTRPASFVTDGAHYDACHASLTSDLSFWISCVRPGMRVLELGCGTGRVAIPLAQAGAIVTGLDASPAMLARARAKSSEVTWVEGEMTSFALADRYELVILAFNTLNVLLTPAAMLACVERAREHLAASGRLIVDIQVPRPAKLLDSTTDEPVTSYRLDTVDVRITARRAYDPSRQLRRLALTIHRSDRAEPAHDVLETHVTFPCELVWLVERAGLVIEAIYGDHSRGPISETAPCHIVVARPV